MLGLTTEELDCLRFNLPSASLVEANEDQANVADRLAKRGLIRKWEEVDASGDKWEYWETNSTGMMMLRIYNSMTFSSGF